MNGRALAGVCALALTVILGAGGCGGGAGDPATHVSGVVTDVDGKPVAGAAVSCSGQSTTSLSNGAFELAGIRRGIQTVSATITINGHRWSGETKVDIAQGEKNRSVNVIVSDDRYHARLTGVVIDPAGFALPGAKIFVGGPWGSTLGIAASDGTYEIRRLTPGVTYTVTCSLAGYVNQTRTVHLSANEVGTLSFALAYGADQGPIPPPTDVVAMAWTVADSVTRSPDRAAYLKWLQRFYRKRKGLPQNPRAAQAERTSPSRATPVGSLIEIDLFWKYAHYDDLMGYAVKRGTTSPPSVVTAVLRDPLAEAFLDIDGSLTPDTTYYYTVHSLDTIGFPAQGRIGQASDVASANPLEPVQAVTPGQGDVVTGDPTFRWTGVYGAATYQVVVWDAFPDLQNPNDPDGIVPLWPADLNNPGASKVNAPQTSLRYSGPYLQSGRTYYWLVIAADTGEYALSVSRIMKFVAR